jgi:aryl-alcohol dehydrogenase-like predicted oxidoreductase
LLRRDEPDACRKNGLSGKGEMKLNRLAESDLNVSEVCLGTMTFGEQNTEKEAHEQLDYAISRGINFIDAAEMYPVPPRAETQGLTETFVGTWLRRQQRDRLVIATKITAPGRGFAWVRGGPKAIDKPSVKEALEGSLRRLQTDYVDLYQIHWPDRYVPAFGGLFYDPKAERPATGIAEQLEALADQVKAGRIRYVGLSNETPWGVLEFLRVARDRGLPIVVSIQNAYNLLNRTFESGLSEVTRHANVPLLAYSPLGFGHLTGKYLAGAKPQAARLTRFPPFGQRYDKPNVGPAVEAYAGLAARSGLSPATMAIAFVRSRWFVASTIIGATGLTQLKENIDAAAAELPDSILAEIDAIHLKYPNPAV